MKKNPPLELSIAEQVCAIMNCRKGRGTKQTGVITPDLVRRAIEGRAILSHPATTEILGEVTRLTAEQKQPAKKTIKKQPRKK